VPGVAANSLFTEDFGWQFSYYLGIPVVLFIIIFSFFFVPTFQKNEEIEEDWISLVPFSILIISLFFLVLFREQYQGLSNIQNSNLRNTRRYICIPVIDQGLPAPRSHCLTQVIAIPGIHHCFNYFLFKWCIFRLYLSMLAKLLGGILGMPMHDVFHFVNFLALIIFVSLIVTVILVAKKFSPYWLLITGLLAVAYTAFTLSD
jgi:hypothetical protein